MFVLFFANRQKIVSSVRSLQESGFFGNGGSAAPKPSLAPQTRDADISVTEAPPAPEAEPQAETLELSGQSLPSDALPLGNDLRELVPPPIEEIEEIAAPAATTQAEPDYSALDAHVPTRQQRLYFISIDNEGRIVRQEVLKDIPRSDSPLSDALNALFAGPSEQEAQRGLRTLIPQGTRLLSATVRDGVAFINLSEEFRFNGFGVDGAIAQLTQLVFTATTFPTVSSVQILIDGQRLEYLSGEGVWIGSPLARKDFSN